MSYSGWHHPSSQKFQTHTQESAKDPKIQSLIQQAQQYKKLKRASKWFSNKPQGTLSYIIPKDWVRKWKIYVSYRETKKNKLPLKIIGEKHPGPISTQSLLIDKETYLNDNDDDDVANSVLKNGLRDYYDYTLYSEDLWKFLHGKYGGTPIKRKFQKVTLGMTRVEYRPKPLRLIILPKLSDILKDPSNFQLPTTQRIYISRYKCLKDLYTRLFMIINRKLDRSITRDGFRLWKLNNYLEMNIMGSMLKNGLIHFQKIQEEHKVKEQKSQSPPTLTEQPNNAKNDEKTEQGAQTPKEPSNPKIEKNTGIHLKGFCLDSLQESKLEDIDLGDDDVVIFEQQDNTMEPHYIFRFKKEQNIVFGKCEYCQSKKRLTVICACKQVSYCTEQCRKRDQRFHQSRCQADFMIDQPGQNSKMGIIGLQNLGNTCFMNSSLQCLSNTWGLTNYFLKHLHSQEINLDNPLGSTKASLVKSYSKLITAMWFGSSSTISPFDFKRSLGEFQPNFKGYNQHDSHEALNFILDGIHQDLNRIKKKPFVQTKECGQQSDQILSHQSWVGHLRRNQSIIVDLMHGQFKSTLDCPNCNGRSVTFDPFLSIGLPVALMKDLVWDVIFVPSKSFKEKCLKAQMTFKRRVSMQSFRRDIMEMFQLKDPYSFLIAISSQDNIVKFLSDIVVTDVFDSYSKKSHKLFVYEIDSRVIQNRKNQQKGMSLEEYVKSQTIAIQSQNKKQVEDDADDSKKKDVANDDKDSDTSSVNLDNPLETEAYENRLLAQYVPKTVDNYNDYMPKQYLRVIVNNIYTNYSSSFAPPRVMFFKRSTPLNQIHLQVFKKLSPLFTNYYKTNEMDPQDFETNYAKIFSEQNKKERSTNYTYSYSYTHKLPYKIKLVNKLHDLSRRSESCFYCGETYCSNCDLPQGKKCIIQLQELKKNGKVPPLSTSIKHHAKDLFSKPSQQDEQLNKNESNEDQLSGEESDIPNQKKNQIYELTLNNLLAKIPKRNKNQIMCNSHHYQYDESDSKSSSYSSSYTNYYGYGRGYSSKPKKFESSDNLDFELIIEWNRNNLGKYYNVDASILSYSKNLSQQDNYSKWDENDDDDDDDDNKTTNNKNNDNDDTDGTEDNNNNNNSKKRRAPKANNEQQQQQQKSKQDKLQQVEQQDDNKQQTKIQGKISKSAKRVSKRKLDGFTLEGCLNYFQQPEKLQAQNEWYCSKCKNHVLATKKVQIYRPPPILIILFKRFKMTNQTRSSYYSSYYSFSSSSQGEKITDLIQFPLNDFNLQPFLVNPDISQCSLYDAYAVSNHYGSVGFGHYTAFGKNSHTGKWYYFDDSRVTQVRETSEIISSGAYAVFYKRKDLPTEIDLEYYLKLKQTIDPDQLISIENEEKAEAERRKIEKEKKAKEEEEEKKKKQMSHKDNDGDDDDNEEE